MRLVEIVAGEETGRGRSRRSTAVAERDGPRPRSGRPTRSGSSPTAASGRSASRALRMLGERVATHAQIEPRCAAGGGFRMGPFELMDLVGVDVGFEVAKSFWEQSFHEPRWQPHPIQAKMVAAGRLGRKAGARLLRVRRRAPGPTPSAAPRRRTRRSRPPAAIARADRLPARERGGLRARARASAAPRTSTPRCGSGFNWPRGPLEWGDEIGAERVVGRARGASPERGERAIPGWRRCFAAAAAEGRLGRLRLDSRAPGSRPSAAR